MLATRVGWQRCRYAGNSILPTPDGKRLVCVTSAGVKIVDLDSQQQVGGQSRAMRDD